MSVVVLHCVFCQPINELRFCTVYNQDVSTVKLKYQVVHLHVHSTVEPPNNERNWDDCFVLLMEVVLCSEAISINFTTRNKTYVGMTMVKKNRDKTNI